MSAITPNPQRVVVLGGGILGVSTAVHLLREGVTVTLVSESELASGATGRSLSWLNSAGARTDPYHRLRTLGIDRYRTLFAQNPDQDWLRFDGGLFWDSPGQATATEERHQHEKSHGYDSLLLKPEQIAEVTPNIEATAVEDVAVFNPGEGWVSLPHLVDHLMEEFDARGGELLTGAGRSSLEVVDGRATGVRTADGTLHTADAVVVACGAATPSVVAEHGVKIDNGSPVSMLVVTEPVEHGVQAVLNTPRAALRPNPGNTLAADHDWYEASIVEHEDGSFTIPDEVVQELLDEASALVAGTPHLTANNWKIGYKPIPGDGEPVFGELERIPGCFVAFTHSGATLGLIGGELLAGEVATGEKHPLLETFRPERFER
ncbi:NAD(P)/FAD-dependent oxidoreductase [Kocuria turfanensis]|uniref:D-amino-acid oxidase n=1 Tax=Kocuria turfanensis TaxID=388357 RepID=A0A512III1_9MICC|nr:FAD-binding oxidoreductase [Kocuria turfanensis]GEO97500.1 D-amino-acid oxidase [Kocuria turfanensis]